MVNTVAYLTRLCHNTFFNLHLKPQFNYLQYPDPPGYNRMISAADCVACARQPSSPPPRFYLVYIAVFADQPFFPSLYHRFYLAPFQLFVACLHSAALRLQTHPNVSCLLLPFLACPFQPSAHAWRQLFFSLALPCPSHLPCQYAILLLYSISLVRQL